MEDGLRYKKLLPGDKYAIVGLRGGDKLHFQEKAIRFSYRCSFSSRVTHAPKRSKLPTLYSY